MDLDSSYGITNVQCRRYLPGRLWLCTDRPLEVQNALHACDIIRRPRRVEMPLSELDVLRWKPESSPKAGQWVRGTRGIYKGDLALVMKDAPFTDIMQIAVVPRSLPYSPPHGGSRKRGKKRKLSRPTPSLFDPAVAQTESFMEEQERVAAASEASQKRSDVASTPTANLTKLLDAVKKTDRFATEEDKAAFKVPYTLPNGTRRSEHEGENVQDTCYQYKGASFVGGLLIKNVLGAEYRLETFPSKQEMVPFVDSRIWPCVILPQFVAMHWKEGDKVSFCAGQFGIPGTIASIGNQMATVRPDFDVQGNVNFAGACVSIGITSLYHRWLVGDGVKAIAGSAIGKEGIIVEVFDDPPYVNFLEKESLATVSSLHD